jgi:cobyrinic acid a,c-diamide synthase
VGGETHARWLNEALQDHCRALPLGWLPRDEALTLPERHLGLVTARERRLTPEFLDALVTAIEKTFDHDRLLSLARSTVEPRSPHPDPLPQRGRGKTAARIGVALDGAFQFYYPANFDLLRTAGAELIFWSPLRDSALPSVDGLYLGGGYPELYARELSANVAMREAIRAFAESGRPLYAECGGLMYLSGALEDLDGNEYPMIGLLPTKIHMKPKKLTLGYAEVELASHTPLGEKGTVIRGHEFHYSRIDEVPPSVPRAYRVRRRRGAEERAEGYLLGNSLLSYVHLHFGANPVVAERFVSSCRGR